MPHKILIIDDDPELQELLTVALRGAGYQTASAQNALAGLDALAHTEIDLVLLDVMMPGMDGLEMLARLRLTNQHLPVLVMTAVSTPETAIIAMREHANDFLAKPFDLNDLTSAVRHALELAPQEVKIEVLSARPEWIELRVPCSLHAIEPLERIMSQLKTDLPAAVRDGVTYAFREMLRNAIEHGGKNDPNQYVEVGYLRTPRVIMYRIKDPGEGFRVESLYHAAILNPESDPTHHERVREQLGMRPGGFGILIASNMVDEMIYNESHNEVVLLKYLGEEAEKVTG